MEKPRVLITGASKGLELAMAKKLAPHCRLILHAFKAENLPEAGPGNFNLCADLSSSLAVNEFCNMSWS